MEKLESLRAAGGLNGESPGNNRVEAGAGLPSVVVFHGSGPPMHSGGIVTRSPESGQLSEGTEVLGSGLNQHPGEVAGHSLGSGTYPGGTSVFGTSNLGFSGPGMYNSEDIPRSGSTRMYPDKLCEDRPRSILKNSSYAVMYKSPRAERKKSQHWDEMNILATYHPTDKDYGFMTVDEPSTPYHRLRGSDEDLLAGTSHTVTPEELAESPVMLPGSTGLNWVIEDPISTEVRLLDHTGSSSEDPEATENSLKVTVTPSKPDETLRLRWTQEEETRQWKM
ncbi:Protein phosphatase inhibitor 2 [Camelus dromedarius]|uniref:Protein phosphatase inhibitor 2 n=1 Tax=Camelus dromedarius TaxID=9838 RepID=A0A5N4D1H8_CAMDR|nr:Protein phosphatase inhibitor 2 [Camelus dromedarius]